MINEIASVKNPLVKQWRQLQTPAGRRAHGLFLAEGAHLCGEAIAAGAANSIIILKSEQEKYSDWLRHDLPVYLVSPQVLKALTDSRTPQGVIAVCALPQPPLFHSLGPRLVALNFMQDPGNVGAILRTVDAAAFSGLLYDPGCADPFSAKALRASMGAVFRVPVYFSDDLHSALSSLRGYALVAGDLNGSPYYEHPDFGDRICLMIGNEGRGLDETLLGLAHFRLKLPILGGAESLNAAVAASLMMYDILRDDLQKQR